MLQTIDIKDLIPGMYVTDVAKQTGKEKIATAGILKSTSDIAGLSKKGILQVTIDLSKSLHEEQPQSENEYQNDSGLTYNQQLELAMAFHDQAKSIHGKLMQRASKGKIANLEEIDEITQEVVNLAFECDDAIGIVTLLKEHADYHIEHSINCAILMVMFGRSLGFERSLLQQLGSGALLMDIGMLKLPLLLTQKADKLSAAETERMQRHVDIGLEMLEPIEDISDVSITVVKQHHERIDGTGYPDGLRESQISDYGKMAAIVDTYDSLTSVRPYREAMKPAAALKKMQQDTSGLCPSLVAQFVNCVGTNPIGSMIKLKSAKLAIVMRLNPDYALSPVVMVFYNLKTQKEEIAQLDLSKVDDELIGSVSPDDFGMELPQFLRQAFFKA